jgi:poly [ADP-ribose] polymerase
MANFVINNKVLIKEKVDMIESLSDIEIATKILEESKSNDDVFDSYYKKLSCQIRHVKTNEKIHSTLDEYLTNTSSDYPYNKLEVLEVFELKRDGEDKRFKDFGNKKLLWHGSRITNFVGILSKGLRIAPPEAPSSGYLFGKGVYFADMASKSANYCSPSNNIALILLCEVSLGNSNNLLTTDYDAANLPKGTHSTKGCGMNVPSEEIELEEGLKIPIGKPTKSTTKVKYILNKNRRVWAIMSILYTTLVR